MDKKKQFKCKYHDNVIEMACCRCSNAEKHGVISGDDDQNGWWGTLGIDRTTYEELSAR